MKAVGSIFTLLLGVAVILAGNGLVGTLLGVRGQLEGLSEAVIGFIMAGYFGGFVIGTYWVPRLIRRIGHIRAFAALASIASVATLLHGLYLQPGLWFALRVVSGFCIVGLYIAIESWLNEQTSNEQRGHVFSAYMTTTLIGLGIGQLLLMAGDARQLELFALASVLLSLGLVPVAMTTVREPLIVESARLGLRKLYAISPLGVVGCIFAGAGTGAFWALGPVFASAIGLDTGGIAAFMSLVIAGGIVMLWPVGKMSDRFERRKILAWTCVLASVAALATALLVAASPLWVMVGGLCYGAFGFSIYSLAAAHTNDHLDPSHMLEVTSTLQLLWSIGAIVAPIAAGLLMHYAGPAALLLFISAMALAPAVFAGYRMRVSDAIPMSEQGDFVPQFVTSPAALEMHPDAEGDLDGPVAGATAEEVDSKTG